ncbi:M1 family metallopeptidase [Flavobacterium sp. SUN052]|uniref:M1 family metallopeptidase n=1 Tax=Flavobacterium sp. SUN052 TaxID=3002441 RepID=UPI00237DBA4C|nr:M1 family metallopeptidase [Flavobacterium sp. SUN052]MEC4005801.1 M1 family metallopeptidase [Flavobacterium sp. SUN052]
MKKILFLLFPIISFAQQIDKVDFIKCTAFVVPEFDSKIVNGKITYQFKVKSAIDSIRIDAKNMSFTDVKINGKLVKFKNNNKELVLFEGFQTGKNKLNFSYQAKPKQTIYFTGIGDGQQIWTQGQGKYTSHWLPSFDDVNEKVIFNLNITFDEKFNVISNGVLKHVFPNKQQKIWEYEMQKPMSSYLVMIAVGDFRNQTIGSKSGIPLQLFIQPKDTSKFEPTYRYSKEIFDFLEKEIGVKYPWQIYRQIPVEDFLYAGMENTSSTVFAQDYVVNESGFNDRNYINVNAHELAHQWFGDMVTAKSGKHHWLQEGFATYYALLAERKIFGDDYFYNALYRNSMLLRKEAKTDTIPILNEKASSYSFYQKGAWALFYLHESIGEKLFQKAVKNYLKKYKFKNVETSDFLNEIAKVSDFDVVKFQKEWLEDYHFQTDKANELLKKSEFIRTLFEIQGQKNKSFEEKEAFFTEIMKSDGFYALKTEIIYQIINVPFVEKEKLIQFAMTNNEINVRQAVAETINTIPISFKTDYETLLNDASYETKETAFTTLWKNFPEEQSNYLELAKNWEGKNDKGLRILFLTYYQLNTNADANLKNSYYDELVNYTSPKYESSIRQNAIENVLEINPKDETVLKNLVNATTHHKWQFVKFARDKIRDLVKQDFYFDYFQHILPNLDNDEQFQLKRLLVK